MKQKFKTFKALNFQGNLHNLFAFKYLNSKLKIKILSVARLNT